MNKEEQRMQSCQTGVRMLWNQSASYLTVDASHHLFPCMQTRFLDAPVPVDLPVDITFKVPLILLCTASQRRSPSWPDPHFWRVSRPRNTMTTISKNIKSGFQK